MKKTFVVAAALAVAGLTSVALQPSMAKTKTAKKLAKTKMVTTKSGLKYVDERVGSGPVAKAGDKVSVNYKGTLADGKVFDQSYGRGPFDFPLGGGQVIKGWDEGVAGMKVGGKRQLHIPSALAYGPRGAGGVIPPNADLVFDVELLGTK